MIVRCPECSTGFKLPVDKVGPKGAKVRCTKCDHVFRVRIVDDEPQIFYKPGEEPAKSPSPAFSDFSNRTAFGGPNSLAENDSEVRESGGFTAVGRPGDVSNLRSTPQKPRASISPMAAGIVNKRKIGRSDEPAEPAEPAEPPVNDSGPSIGRAVSEADDSTSIGKPIEESYSPKATSFGLPSVGGGEGIDPFADEDDLSDADRDLEADPAPTSFGFPSAAPDQDSIDPDEEGDDDTIRGTAFGRPVAQDDSPTAEEQFEENPKGTLFGLPAVADDLYEEEKEEAKPTVEVSDDELDLFDDESETPPEREEFDDDPFAGAFADEIDERPGIEIDPGFGTDDEFDFGGSDDVGPSDEDAFAKAFAADETSDGHEELDEDDSFFTGGGGGSDFGDADQLVDPTFGSDGPVYDPEAGETVQTGATEREPTEPRGVGASPGEISFDESPGQGIDLVMETSPPPAAEREQQQRRKAAPAPASTSGSRRAVATRSSGTSSLQKGANFLLIVMLVSIAFIGVILWKTGGVVDFGRFDHMLEIVIEDKPFEPRPEWGIEKRTADEVEPLQAENVFAYPTSAKKGDVLVVHGDLSNKGTTAFSGVKMRISLVGSDGTMIADQIVPAGTTLDSSRLEKLEAKAFDEAIVRQMSTVEPGAQLPFTAVFPELPAEKFDKIDILIEVAEKAALDGGDDAEGAEGSEETEAGADEAETPEPASEDEE